MLALLQHTLAAILGGSHASFAWMPAQFCTLVCHRPATLPHRLPLPTLCQPAGWRVDPQPLLLQHPPHQSTPRSHPGTLPRALPQHTTRPCLLAAPPRQAHQALVLEALAAWMESDRARVEHKLIEPTAIERLVLLLPTVATAGG